MRSLIFTPTFLSTKVWSNICGHTPRLLHNNLFISLSWRGDFEHALCLWWSQICFCDYVMVAIPSTRLPFYSIWTCSPAHLRMPIGWASAEMFPERDNVEILLIVFRFLTMQRKWTFTKRKKENVTKKGNVVLRQQS